MSQEQLAYDSKLDRSFLGKIERNEAAPSLDSFFRLAKGLRMRRENLFVFDNCILSHSDYESVSHFEL